MLSATGPRRSTFSATAVPRPVASPMSATPIKFFRPVNPNRTSVNVAARRRLHVSVVRSRMILLDSDEPLFVRFPLAARVVNSLQRCGHDPRPDSRTSQSIQLLLADHSGHLS